MHERLNAAGDAERPGPDRAADSRVSERKRRNRTNWRGPAIHIHASTEQLLVAQEYAGKGKKAQGSIRRYPCKVTGPRPARNRHPPVLYRMNKLAMTPPGTASRPP